MNRSRRLGDYYEARFKSDCSALIQVDVYGSQGCVRVNTNGKAQSGRSEVLVVFHYLSNRNP